MPDLELEDPVPNLPHVTLGKSASDPGSVSTSLSKIRGSDAVVFDILLRQDPTVSITQFGLELHNKHRFILGEAQTCRTDVHGT